MNVFAAPPTVPAASIRSVLADTGRQPTSPYRRFYISEREQRTTCEKGGLPSATFCSSSSTTKGPSGPLLNLFPGLYAGEGNPGAHSSSTLSELRNAAPSTLSQCGATASLSEAGEVNRLFLARDDKDDDVDHDTELRQARGLLRRYREENERLRERLNAHALRESFLTQRLQHLGLENARLSSRSRELTRGGDPFSVEDRETEEVGEPRSVSQRAVVQQKDRTIRELEERVHELEGRLHAYEEAFLRDGVGEEGDDAASGVSLHGLLCQSLSEVGYLTKVFNALNHCWHTPHPSSECPRSLQECRQRCLHAASKGNTESIADVLSRGHQLQLNELGLALREELQYCETAAVRLAAEVLQEGSAAAPSVEAQRSPAGEADAGKGRVTQRNDLYAVQKTTEDGNTTPLSTTLSERNYSVTEVRGGGGEEAATGPVPTAVTPPLCTSSAEYREDSEEEEEEAVSVPPPTRVRPPRVELDDCRVQ